VEGLKGRLQVASRWGGSSFLCDTAERRPRGSVTVKTARAVLFAQKNEGPLLGL